MTTTTWLRKQFEFEYCCECGGDEEDHVASLVLGNPFAWCKHPVSDEDVDDIDTILKARMNRKDKKLSLIEATENPHA